MSHLPLCFFGVKGAKRGLKPGMVLVEVVLSSSPQPRYWLERIPQVRHGREIVGKGDAEESLLLQDAVCFCLRSAHK